MENPGLFLVYSYTSSTPLDHGRQTASIWLILSVNSKEIVNIVINTNIVTLTIKRTQIKKIEIKNALTKILLKNFGNHNFLFKG